MWRSFLCSFLFAMGVYAQEVTLMFDTSKEQRHVLLDDFFSENSTPQIFSLTSDCGFQQSEFYYLAGLKRGQQITREDFERAVDYLVKLERFTSLTCQIKNNELHCFLEGQWIVGNVTLSGILLGKNQHLQHYDLFAGQVFNQELHEAAVQKVVKSFHQKGYRNAMVTDKVSYLKKNKTVQIALHCQKGQQFYMDLGSVTFEAEESKYLPIIKTIKTLLNKKLSQKHYNEDTIASVTKEIKDVLQNAGFSKTAIKLQESTDYKHQNVSLHFTFFLGQQKAVYFVGNHFMNDQTLAEYLMRHGASFDLLPGTLLAEDIVKKYHKQGFLGVTVDTYEQDDGTLYFTIHEGERAHLNEIIIKGTAHITCQDAVKNFFKKARFLKYIDTYELQKAEQALLNWYRSEGFADIVLLKNQYESSGQEHNYNYVITLDEGKQYFFKIIMIDDEPELINQGPFGKITSEGQSIPFTHHELAKQRAWLLEYYKQKGYVSAQVNSELVYEGDAVTVMWAVKKGEPITCGLTLVKGPSQVASSIIRNCIALKTGSAWDQNGIKQACQRLRALDVFKQIRMYPLLTEDERVRDLAVFVQDDDPFEIRIRGGFQQVSKNFAIKKSSTYKFGTSLLWRNPLRKGGLARCDFDATRFEKRIDTSYRFPLLFSFPCMATFKGFAYYYTQPLSPGSSEKLYHVSQEGFSANVTSQTGAATLGCITGLQWLETKDISTQLAQIINFKADLIDKKIPYLFIEPSFFIDLLDNKVNPTKGIFFGASLKGMFPLWGSSYFVKLLVEKGFFFPLIKEKSIVCGARVKFGHIFKETFSKIMPPERFYLGGASSLRGYLPDSCPPLGTLIDENGKLFRVPQGGKSMVNMNMEMRIPVTQQVGLVLFQDFGILVKDTTSLAQGKGNLASSGCGIRYQTPLGPLRFDIGLKWQKPFPEDTRYAWFLTFGHAF